MENHNKKYVDDWFININIDKIPFAFYLIRSSLLRSVSELKPMLHGYVVDLACGVMPYKEYLMNPLIDKYIGIDLEQTQYHNRAKPDLYWDGKNIPIEDSSCDFVIATEFLEHYFDTDHILKEIKRVLKDGGIFFFTVPSLWPIHEAPYDYHRFTPFALIEHFKSTNYGKWVIKPLGGYHYSLALMISLWNDNNLSPYKRKIIRPLLKILIKKLIKKDKVRKFENDSFYSGIYGFLYK